MESSTRVVVVECQEVLRRGLLDMLAEVPGVRTETFDDAREIRRTGPGATVAIIDAIPRPDADDDAHAGLREFAELIVLVPSADPGHLALARQWCADGYVMISEVSPASLADAIYRVRAGETPMPREVARFLGERAQNPRATAGHLTPRESEVLALLIEGLSNKQIAYRLGVSLHGAKRHVSSILSKLNCTNRAQVVARSLQLR